MPVPVDLKGEGAGKGKKKSHKQQARSSHLDVNSQLLEAVAQNRLRVVRRLLESGADPNYQGGSNNSSSLMLAIGVEGGGPGEATFSLLLHKGADVNLQDTQGRTALIHAVLAGQARAVEQLLESGVDASMTDQEGNSALSYAAMSRLGGSEGCVQLLALDKGVNIDHQNLRGLTPLLLAAQAGNMEVARILVEAGASLSKRDLEHFMTAQDWMKKEGSYSDQQLDFLSPSRKRRTFYRQERIKKGIKTLSDFLPNIEDTGGTESPNVFTIRRCDASQPNTDHTPTFPSIQTQAKSSPAHRSMFDILSKKSEDSLPQDLQADKSKKNAAVHFSSVASVKMDLYKSPYLSKRQSLLHRNVRSEGYHTGALAPLTSPTHAQPASSKKTGKPNSKKTKLPPITKK